MTDITLESLDSALGTKADEASGLRWLYSKPCTPPLEFAQCPFPCGAVWTKPPHTSWATYSLCPECHKHSTYDIDMEWVLVEDAEESCWGNTRPGYLAPKETTP